MTRIIMAACFLIIATGCAHDRFSLINVRTGEEVGQFTYRTGAKVAIGGNTYQIRKIGSEESVAEQYLKMTMIPSVDMCSVHPCDVLNYLSECLREYGPTNTCWKDLRPNIQFDVSREKMSELPWVTIAGVQYLSAYECLKRLCKQTDCTMSFDGQYVWLKPKKIGAQQSAPPLPRAPETGHSEGAH